MSECHLHRRPLLVPQGGLGTHYTLTTGSFNRKKHVLLILTKFPAGAKGRTSILPSMLAAVVKRRLGDFRMRGQDLTPEDRSHLRVKGALWTQLEEVPLVLKGVLLLKCWQVFATWNTSCKPCSDTAIFPSHRQCEHPSSRLTFPDLQYCPSLQMPIPSSI